VVGVGVGGVGVGITALMTWLENGMRTFASPSVDWTIDLADSVGSSACVRPSTTPLLPSPRIEPE